ncbi:MAG: valine--tRNA ligase, partial [Clostridia bacterium]
ARSEYQVPPSKRIRLSIKSYDAHLPSCKLYIEKLVGAEEINFVQEYVGAEEVVSLVCSSGEAHIPLGDLVDKQKEIERINKELTSAQEEIIRAESKLNNKGFVAKAPAKLIEEEKAKLLKWKELETKLSNRLMELSK